MNYENQSKINENKRIKKKINITMGAASTILATSCGLLTIGMITDNHYMVVGSMTGAIIGIGTALRNYDRYNYGKTIISPSGPDDWSYTEKSLKEQYENADKEIKRLKKIK